MKLNYVKLTYAFINMYMYHPSAMHRLDQIWLDKAEW